MASLLAEQSEPYGNEQTALTMPMAAGSAGTTTGGGGRAVSSSASASSSSYGALKAQSTDDAFYVTDSKRGAGWSKRSKIVAGTCSSVRARGGGDERAGTASAPAART
ncbi:hypothetical protein EON62_02255 [archaeon]|nr:MAG: hypothetical protein EON62_02255 [archaeon]